MTQRARARRLIVNADDFGLSPGVNAGVASAHRHGILTSATLLANAPHFAAAARLAAECPALGVGVHLNLVRGVPLSPARDIPTLIDGAGRLRPFRLRIHTPRFLRDAETEYRRQIEAVLRAGVQPTHVDFEKHHAWRRGLYGLACRLAAEYGFGAVRNLREPVAWAVRRAGWPGWKRVAMAAALRSGVTLGGADCGGTARPDRLLGQTHIGLVDAATLEKMVRRLPEGVSELMTHPGLPEPSDWDGGGMGGSWLAAARTAEHAALVADNVRRAVEECGVELVHFGALQSQKNPCASSQAQGS